MKKLEINIGDKFWKFIILGEVINNRNNKWEIKRKFNCKCECWNIKQVDILHLRSWHTKSCWCSKLWLIHKYSHLMSWSRIYRIYQWIKTRCYNINHIHYKNYWGRWIKCDWNSFEEFYRDMWENYKDWLTIDRINNDWNYCKNNCRWATYKEQANNQNNNYIIYYEWKKYTKSQLSEKFNIKYSTFSERLKRWWSIEKTVKL